MTADWAQMKTKPQEGSASAPATKISMSDHCRDHYRYKPMCLECDRERHIAAYSLLDQAPGSAFIRQCDTCGTTTAIDLDPTPEHWREMCLYGQTIRTMPEAEAMELWKTAGRCKCTPNRKVSDERTL